jgi:hypothetical protein
MTNNGQNTAGPSTGPSAQNSRSNTRAAGKATTSGENHTVAEANTRTLLEKSGYLTKGDKIRTATLTTILKQLASYSGKAPKTLTDGIKAIVILLEGKLTDMIVEETTRKIMQAITPTVEKLMQEIDRMNTVTEELQAKVSTLEEARNDDPPQNPTNGEPNPTAPRRMTYATVTQVHVPPQHAAVMARSQGHERQVLIKGNQGHKANGLRELNERQLIEKANLVVELMGEAVVDKPQEGNIFLGTQKLPRGGVLYLMTTPEAANWMKRHEIKEAFLQHYGGTAWCRASSWFTTGPIKTIDPDTHRIFSQLCLFRRLQIRYRIIRLPSNDPDHHRIPHQSLPSLRMAYKTHRITEMHTSTHHTRHLRLYQRSYGLSDP